MNREFKSNLLQLKQWAFTLAETLIVMGIIGVVAALTLPNLNSSTGDKEKVVKLQKIYQNMNDVVGRATAVYGPPSTWCANNSDVKTCTTKFAERITEFMKLSKNCGATDNTNCFTSGYSKTLNNENFMTYNGNSSIYKVITADGSSLGFNIPHTDCTFKRYSRNNQCGYFYIDIDGPNKGSFTEGKDVFAFDFFDDMIIPYGSEAEYEELKSECFQKGYACSTWVINNQNMDYLKADINGQCKNSNVTLNETVTSCK